MKTEHGHRRGPGPQQGKQDLSQRGCPSWAQNAGPGSCGCLSAPADHSTSGMGTACLGLFTEPSSSQIVRLKQVP